MEGLRARNGGWITPVNLDVLRQFTEDHESRELILAASHRVADGVPIVWASRVAGTPVPERVNGTDLAFSLPQAAAQAGVSVFLLGGNPGVAAAAAGRLRARYPGLRSVDSYCPPFGFENDPEELDTDQGGGSRRTAGAGPGWSWLSEAGKADQLAPVRAAPNLVRGCGDIAQLPRGGATTRTRCPATPRSRVDAPSLARAPSTVQAVCRSGSPVRPQAFRLGAGSSGGRGTLNAQVAQERKRCFHEPPGRPWATLWASRQQFDR